MGKPTGFMEFERQAPELLPVDERLKHHDEHYEELSEDKIKTQASRCMDCGVPFCMSGCPLGNLIPEWNDLVFRGRWEDAVKALHATNNFPEFTGRVCPAPCENSCVLGITDPPVTIKLHEKSIIDYAFDAGWIKAVKPEKKTGKTVAVIGGGPAGMACAQQLNRAGHEVTVYEKHDRAGGLMMYGIPHYKLRKEKVQRRIDLMIEEGVKFEFGAEIGKTIQFADIKAKHDAVVVSTGAENPRDLPVEGRELDGIHFAMEFLPQSNRRNWGDEDPAALHPEHKLIDAKDKKVIVIGGGDTGSDCIGTSLRQGATSVINFELLGEPPAERTPGNPWPQYARVKRISSSVEEMLAKGGEVVYSVATKKFHGKDGKVTGLTTIDLDWSNGRPEEIAGSEREWECDLVLFAMGFLGPRGGLMEQIGCELDQRSNMLCDPETRMSSIDGVFGAGDCRRGQSLVVWAISEGREVAHQVDKYLMGSTELPTVRIDPFQY